MQLRTAGHVSTLWRAAHLDPGEIRLAPSSGSRPRSHGRTLRVASPPRLPLAAALLATTLASAGGLPRHGGELRVVTTGRSAERDPLLADTPVDAALLLATAAPPCRLGDLSRPGPTVVRLALPHGPSPESLQTSLERVRTSGSAYAALLAPVRAMQASPQALEFTLTGPWPEFEQVLCHPALAITPGPFSGPAFAAEPRFPGGRPWVDTLAPTVADPRGAERLFAQRRAHLVVGSGPDAEGPQLFATALLVSPGLAPHLAAAVEATVDRADLAHFFLRAPASPLASLLPPALGGAAPSATRPARPAPLSPVRDVALLFDASVDDQRALAERLQVKLQPAGYRVALKPLPRPELRARLAKGDYELALGQALLPPSAPLAVAVLAALSGHPLADATSPPAALPGVIPLAVQGLALSVTRDLRHLVRDAQGLPRLDDAWLSPE